jgi:hypothetical protein
MTGIQELINSEECGKFKIFWNDNYKSTITKSKLNSWNVYHLP